MLRKLDASIHIEVEKPVGIAPPRVFRPLNSVRSAICTRVSATERKTHDRRSGAVVTVVPMKRWSLGVQPASPTTTMSAARHTADDRSTASQVNLLRRLVVLHIPAQTTNFHERQGSRNRYTRSKQKKHAPFSHCLPHFLLVLWGGTIVFCSGRCRQVTEVHGLWQAGTNVGVSSPPILGFVICAL